MKTCIGSKLAPLALVAASFFTVHPTSLPAQGTTFVYDGQLNPNTVSADGVYEFAFALYTDPVAGTGVGNAITNVFLGVTNSAFMTTLDFGSPPWTGQLLWLQISIRTNSSAPLTALSPRQQMYPAPYAIMATSASNLLGNLPSGKLNGTYGGMVTLSSLSNNISGTFTGNGAALNSVNASTLGGLSSGNFWQLGGNTVGSAQTIGCLNNQPLQIRASAVSINTNSTAATFFVAGNQFVETLAGSSTAGTWLTLNNSSSSNARPWSVVSTGSANGEGIGKFLIVANGASRMIVDVSGNVTANSFTPTSDRNAKENFEPVNTRDVLDKVAALPLTKWNFKQDSATKHVGPMAQDFYAAFGVGPDDKHIATVDADGVALAAIQGLNQRLTDELRRRDAENVQLRARLEKLEQLIESRNGGAK